MQHLNSFLWNYFVDWNRFTNPQLYEIINNMSCQGEGERGVKDKEPLLEAKGGYWEIMQEVMGTSTEDMTEIW
jgi:hypothetical protein